VELAKTGEDAVFAADRTDGATAKLSAGTNSVQIGSITSHPLELVVNNTPVVTLTDQGNLTLVGALSTTARLSAGMSSVQIGSITFHPLELVVNNTPVVTLTDQGNLTLVGALSTTARLSAGMSSVQIGSVTSHPLELLVNSTPVMTLTNQGNLTLAGALSEYSDVNAKKNLTPVNGNDVLKRLTGLQVMTWNYKADDANVQHMGPMAQDFYAAFGLGPDNQHIAALDANGVSLAAIQALTQITTEQDARITQLEDENAELKTRLTALEDLVKVLLAQQSK
jgi:hypothetical protein